MVIIKAMDKSTLKKVKSIIQAIIKVTFALTSPISAIQTTNKIK